MFKHKKGQSVLPFFGLNLISLFIFFIVVIALLVMAKNLRFSMNEFNEETLPIVLQKRIISSADCFAYEIKDITFDEDGKLLTGSKVYPGVLDINKLTDVDYFNCMRKDTYDVDSAFYSKKGNWDAEEGTGASFKYAISVYDPANGKAVYKSHASEDDPNPTDVNSILLRVNKKEDDCDDYGVFGDDCHDYGKDWDCITTCKEYSVGLSGVTVSSPKGPLAHLCEKGRCELQENGLVLPQGGVVQISGTEIKPYWEIKSPSPTVLRTSLITPSTNYEKEDWYPEGNTDSDGTYSLLCEDTSNVRRSVIPVMINYRDNNEELGNMRPGIIIIESCVVIGDKYDGLSVLEDLILQPDVESDCYS